MNVLLEEQDGKRRPPHRCFPTMRPLFHVSIPRARPSRAPFLGLLCFLTVVDALQLRMPTSCGCPPSPARKRTGLGILASGLDIQRV